MLGTTGNLWTVNNSLYFSHWVTIQWLLIQFIAHSDWIQTHHVSRVCSWNQSLVNSLENSAWTLCLLFCFLVVTSSRYSKREKENPQKDCVFLETGIVFYALVGHRRRLSANPGESTQQKPNLLHLDTLLPVSRTVRNLISIVEEPEFLGVWRIVLGALGVVLFMAAWAD